MTSKPRLMAATPDKPDLNGLIDLHDDLLRDRTTPRYAIVEFIVPEVTDKTLGDQIPKVQLTQIEPFQPGAQLDQLIGLLDAHFLARNQFTRGSSNPSDTPLDLSVIPGGDAKFDAAAPVTPIGGKKK